jgi:hypothetical protein
MMPRIAIDTRNNVAKDALIGEASFIGCIVNLAEAGLEGLSGSRERGE